MESHCHCGAVRWARDAEIAWSCCCHCADCRRTCAAPVTAFIGLPQGSVTWSGDAPRVYRSSEDAAPRFHVFHAEHLHWLNIEDSLPRYAGTAT